ncbi:MAG: SAM domain-containing protein, partial [Verrucomicrobiota bacterium]
MSNPTSSPATVEEWLASIGMAEYAAVFAQNHITLDLLRDLTDADLKNCGITALGHRKEILRAIEAIRSGPPTPEPVPPAAAVLPVHETNKKPSVWAFLKTRQFLFWSIAFHALILAVAAFFVVQT